MRANVVDATVLRRLHERRAPLVALALLACALGAAGCATQTSVTQVWSAPVRAVTPMRKVVVMATQMDEANRRALEDSFTRALAAHGVQGIPSYSIFGDKLPARAEAQAAVDQIGADGILTANFKGIREELSYPPGYYAGGFWGGYYGSGYGYTGWYGYADEYVNLETTLWDTRVGDTVVWAVLTSTTNPTSGRDFVTSVTKKVIPALADARLIPPGPKKY
jgi:hypothetical protein